MKTSSFPRRVALAALILAAACTDRAPTASAPRGGEEVSTQIACTVRVADARVRCGGPAGDGGPAESIILGGQGTYLRLESSNVAYDSATDVFSLDVTVRNLLAQRMGTPDGTTVSGVQVFFEQEPVASVGTGDIAVANADGEDSFTRTAQPYFHYPQILEPRGTSQPRTWRFGVPASVQEFHFTVYVRTELPVERGTLRWEHEHGDATRSPVMFDGIWGASREEVYAVGSQWVMTLDSVTGWEPMARAPAFLYDIWGVSSREVYVAGDSGVVMRYDGNRWETRRGPTAPHQLAGIWSDGGEVWAVGRRRDTPAGDVNGLILRSGDDGASWTETLSSGTGLRYLRDVFRAGGSVFAVGYEDPAVAGAAPRAGVVLRSTDGGATWRDSLVTGGRGLTFHSVWADGPADVYIGGELQDAATGARRAVLLHSTDGGATWSWTVPGNGSIQSLWRVPGGRLYAVGTSQILVNDGGTWSEFDGGTCVGMSAGWSGVWGSAEDDLHVIAFSDFNWRFDGTCWRATTVEREWVEALNAVSAVGHDGYALAVGQTPVPDDQGGALYYEGVILLTYGGSDWGYDYRAGFASSLRDVWVGSLDTAVAVGWRDDGAGGRAGLILRRIPNAWQNVTPASARDVPLGAVWATGTEVHAFGARAGAVVVYRSINGAATWSETAIPYTGAGTPQVTDAWGSAGALHVSGYAEIVSGADTTWEGFMLHHDGTAWRLAVGTGDGAQLTGVWSMADAVFVSGHRRAAGNRWNGFVRRSVDGGASWVETALAAPAGDGRVEGIWGGSPRTVYAVGGGGLVHGFDGADWSTMLGTDRSQLLGIGGSSDTDVYAVGRGGGVFHGTR